LKVCYYLPRQLFIRVTNFVLCCITYLCLIP